MEICIKDICFLIDIDPFCSSSDLINGKIYTDDSLLQDLLAVKNHSIHYKSAEIIPSKVNNNSFNTVNPMDYFLKGNLPYFGHHLDQVAYAFIPFELNPNFIFVEDYQDLDNLESLALVYDAKIFSTKSFNRRSKNVFVYKGYLNIAQKITLLRKSCFYVGYDNSELAPIGKKIHKENSIIYKSNILSDEQLMFRFINEDNIDFFKI